MAEKKKLTTYNVQVSVIEEMPGTSRDDAITRLAAQLSAAGFNVLTSHGYADAFVSENQPPENGKESHG